MVNERAIREIYLKGFEICVRKTQPHALMTSYNLQNGEHTCSSKALLKQILRDEWGFEGIVMSDWRVTSSMRKNNGKYSCASAAGCVKAGNDIIMPGSDEDRNDILSALNDGAHPYPLNRGDLCKAHLRYGAEASWGDLRGRLLRGSAWYERGTK